MIRGGSWQLEPHHIHSRFAIQPAVRDGRWELMRLDGSTWWLLSPCRPPFPPRQLRPHSIRHRWMRGYNNKKSIHTPIHYPLPPHCPSCNIAVVNFLCIAGWLWCWWCWWVNRRIQVMRTESVSEKATSCTFSTQWLCSTHKSVSISLPINQYEWADYWNTLFSFCVYSINCVVWTLIWSPFRLEPISYAIYGVRRAA